jgi:hypothetical protein
MLQRSMAATMTFWLARAKTGGVDHPVLVDATVDVAGPLASPSTKCAFRALTLEGLLE